MLAERIRSNLDAVQCRIAEAARRAGRPMEAIRLVAVTKKTPLEWIKALVDCGARDLGENYPQELWTKADALADLQGSVHWHLIGHLQTNKVKKTLPMVQDDPFCRLTQAVASPQRRRARRQRSARRVCLQVNTSDEPSKHGWTAEQILQEAELDRRLPRDPDRRLDDDGRARDHRRDRPRIVRAAPRAA